MRKQRRRLHLERLEGRELLAASDVIISEFMAVNKDGIRDQDGETSDWIELYNTSHTSVDIGGLFLADSADRWEIPRVTLAPNDFLLVFASGKDRTEGELHTNFKLSAEGEPLKLLDADGVTVIHEYANYPFQVEEKSYGVAMTTGTESTLLSSGADAAYLVPNNDSLGLTWTLTTFDDQEWEKGATGIGYETSGSNYSPLLANRVPPGTRGFYARIKFDAKDLNGLNDLTLKMKYDDGFIAYLNGQRVADGNGPLNPAFDSLSTGENADGDAQVFERFDISRFENLVEPSGNVLAIHALNRATSSSDMLMLPELAYSEPGTTDVNQAGFFAVATPGGSNGTPVAGFTAPVTIDLPHGFYDQPQVVTITTDDLEAVIRYTTDGSVPTANTGEVYSGPVTIDHTTVLRAAAFKGDLEPSAVDTATYLFVADVAKQDRAATLDAGFPVNWNGTSADYGLDPDVIGPNDRFQGKYADSIADDLKAIPTLSIVMDVDDMFGSQGIYANPTNSNLEEAASLELIHPDGTQGFQIDAGLKIQGGAFRSFGLTKKKSFRFKFQKQYGAAKLEYPLFGPDATDSFDTITLRMEANDGWQWSDGDNTNRLYARDEWNRRTQLAMGQPGSHGTFAHVYINGFYWGTYNVVERPDEGFASDYIGGDKDDWDVQNSGNAINGDLNSWSEMLRHARDVSNAAAGSSEQLAAWFKLQGLNPDGTNNPDYEDYLDVENYIDYLIVNMYGGNSDWPHKNYYAGRQRGPESTGFKFFMWDAEWSLDLKSSVTTNLTNISSGIAQPYSMLRNVPEFQLWFADRVHKHFAPGGALYVDPGSPQWDPDYPERNVPAARFAEIVETMRSPLVAESARWGDQHGGPYTVDESWQPRVDSMFEDYFPRRTANVLRQFERAGLSSELATPEFLQPSGVLVDSDVVSLSAPAGMIYYTTDGSDPRLPGGDVAATAVQYEGPIAVTEDVQIRVRAKDGSNWSAIGEARFVLAVTPASSSNLAISEIHFNPQPAGPAEPDVDNDEFEFIEVTNISPTRIDLTDVQFVETDVNGDTQGIRFTFNQQTLGPGESLVVVENIEAFQSRYGNSVRIALGQDQSADPIGQYGGRLANGGELLTLVDSSGQMIRQFAYDDAWQPTTDGQGYSLEIVDLLEKDTDRLSSASLWQASNVVGGTPGQTPTPAIVEGDLNRDGFVNRADVDLLYAAIEGGSNDPLFDLSQDGIADALDANLLIEDILGVKRGDTNLDGTVDFADFVVLAANFGQPTNNTWFGGDFDADGKVTFADFVELSSRFGL